MKRCILHIGMHKTGSSSIQQSLKNFASKDFRYARLLKTPNHSGAIIQAFSESIRNQWRGSDHPIYGQKDIAQRVKARLEKQLKRAKADTLIVSGEGIPSLTLKEIDALKQFIGKYVSQTIVVCYIRLPESYMNSAAQQRIKAGLDAFDFSAFYPSYRDRLEKFDQLFGQENVKLWTFNSKLLKNGCVVSDFCARFGIDIPSEDIVRVNESLSLNALSLLYSYHKHARNSADLINEDSKSYALLVQSLVDLKGGKFRLSPELIAPIIKKNYSDIDWMEQRLGESLKVPIAPIESYVSSESDLLSPSDAAIHWLLEKLDNSYSQLHTEDISLAVAKHVHLLRQKLSDSSLSHYATRLV